MIEDASKETCTEEIPIEESNCNNSLVQQLANTIIDFQKVTEVS